MARWPSEVWWSHEELVSDLTWKLYMVVSGSGAGKRQPIESIRSLCGPMEVSPFPRVVQQGLMRNVDSVRFWKNVDESFKTCFTIRIYIWAILIQSLTFLKLYCKHIVVHNIFNSLSHIWVKLDLPLRFNYLHNIYLIFLKKPNSSSLLNVMILTVSFFFFFCPIS